MLKDFRAKKIIKLKPSHKTICNQNKRFSQLHTLGIFDPQIWALKAMQALDTHLWLFIFNCMLKKRAGKKLLFALTEYRIHVIQMLKNRRFKFLLTRAARNPCKNGRTITDNRCDIHFSAHRSRTRLHIG